MKKQQGAALVVVLVLLAISLMLGLSGVQSSLMGERMAGNYRTNTLAYNEAEAGILVAAEAIKNVGSIAELMETSVSEENQSLVEGTLNPLGRYEVTGPFFDGGLSFRLVSDGYYGAEGRQASRQVNGLFIFPQHYPKGLMACENLNLSGGGLIDSYDSSAGDYGIEGNKHRSNVAIGTRLQGAQTTFAGGSTVYGQVLATGDMDMNSAAVIGSIRANGDLTTDGPMQEINNDDGHIFGNVEVQGDITLSRTTHGNVRAAQKIHFGSNSYVYGDVTAKTFSGVDPPPASGTALKLAGGAEVTAVDAVASAEECNDFDVPTYWERFAEIGSSCPDSDDCHLNESGVNLQMGKEGIYTDDPNDPLYEAQHMTIDGRDFYVVRLDSFSLSGQYDFTVGATGNPVNMVMVVDGNTTIEGDTSDPPSRFSVKEKSTLQVVTSGKFKATSGVSLTTERKPSVEDNGKVWPVLSLFSTYEDGNERQTGNWEPGVLIEGKSDFYGLMSAPFSQVGLHGQGDIYGAVNAREIDFSGGAGFHYDENLSEMDSLEEGVSESSIPKLVRLYETAN